MCGIFGFFGNYSLKETLNCLKKLEYRGYDSAGIAYENNEIIKSVGRISKLESKIEDKVVRKAISHTRWATNGEVLEVNAHPHISHDGTVVLVHNGILENEHEITSTYLKDITFKSDTDSEKIACLLAILLNDNSPLATAKKLMEIIKGSYAIVFMIKNDDSLYYLKNNSSLILGYDNENYYISSDLYALPSTCTKYKHIPNHTCGSISNEVVTDNSPFLDYDFSNSIIVNNDMMLKEIKEELDLTDKLELLIDDYYQKYRDLFESSDEIILIGTGSSYYAAMYIEKLIKDIIHKKATCVLASEFDYNLYLYSKNTLFILISQSGETADVINAANKIMNGNLMLITNSINSILANRINNVMCIEASKEIAVAATKTFNQTVLLMYLFLLKLTNEEKNELSLYKANISYFIDNCSNFDKYLKYEKIFFIGKGYDYIASLEAALKVKEITYVSSWGYQASELKHGSLALVDEKTLVIGFSSQIESYLLHNLNEVKARKGSTELITVPLYSKYLGALSLITYSQLLSYYLAKLKGLDPDYPRNLAKSVTVI